MKKIALLLLCTFFVSQAFAQSQSFNFRQSGFAEGATVSGTFTGEDLDGNGQLSSFDGEITDFQMSFSGNSVVAAFSLGFAELFGLVYDLDGGPLGDGQTLAVEGVGAAGMTFSYQAGPGPVAECGVGVDCALVSDGTNTDASQELILVVGQAQSVPIPAWSYLLMIMLIAAVGIRSLR